jgi:TonB family protein
MVMKLAGDLAEFSLADLVQVAGVAGRTCCVRVMAADGNGTLYLHGGEVVSAVFENLGGFDAFVALLAARAGHFQVENGASPEQRNLQGNVQKLLLEANARIEAGGVPKPERRPMPPAPVSASTPAAAAGPARAAARGWWIGVAAALLLLGAVGWLAFARHDAAAGAGDPPAAAGAPAAATQPAIEATLLTGPADALPALITGAPPASPDPAATLKPTIVCRLLVAADGRVADAKIYRSRLDLATFEDTALDAVRQYRFAPGRQAGRPVPVWINWPVTFR